MSPCHDDPAPTRRLTAHAAHATTWYLTELAEARGKHELFTRQSPQKLKVLLKKLGQMPKPLKPASTQLAADILEKEHRIVEVMETIQRRLTKAE